MSSGCCLLESNSLSDSGAWHLYFCVGSVADALKMSAKDVYHQMSKGGIFSDYILVKELPICIVLVMNIWQRN